MRLPGDAWHRPELTIQNPCKAVLVPARVNSDMACGLFRKMVLGALCDSSFPIQGGAMQVTIRPALASDLAEIARVNVESWRHVCRTSLPDRTVNKFTHKESRATWRSRFRHLLKMSEHLLVAEADGIVGFCYFGPGRDNDLEDKTSGQIYLLYVKPNVIGTGAGKALIQHAIASLHSAGFVQIRLWVIADNKRARDFYSRQGFDPDGWTGLDLRTGALRLRYLYGPPAALNAQKPPEVQVRKGVQTMNAQNSSMVPRTVIEPGMGTLEVFPLDTSEQFLFTLLKDLFENHWQKVQFGILIQGCVLELSAPHKPEKVALFDGYLTVEFGKWHMHVCLGESKGTGCEPTPPEVAAHRRPSRAELYRKLNGRGQPTFWALRIYNGKDEQVLTVFLPNPLLTDDMNYAKEPDWTRLAIWDYLRKTYLGLEQDPKDRTASKFSHD